MNSTPDSKVRRSGCSSWDFKTFASVSRLEIEEGLDPTQARIEPSPLKVLEEKADT